MGARAREGEEMRIEYAIALLSIYSSCSFGSAKVLDYDKLPERNSESVIWEFCGDSDLDLCRPFCDKFGRDNNCSKWSTKRMTVKEAKAKGFWVMDKSVFKRTIENK
jgi:hypothetical protein